METKIILLSAADDFIKSTHLKMSAKIDRTLLLLAQYGYKLRVSQGNNIARLFYFHYGRQVFVVTSGYMKKSQKTDQLQLTNALKIMKDIKEKGL